MALTVENNEGYHNHYRGIYLGSYVTDEQYSHIADGTFEDLYVGDYWIIDGNVCRIAGCNYFKGCGDTENITNHIVIVTDNILKRLDGTKVTAQMNSTDIVTGAYVGSNFWTGTNSNTALAETKKIVNDMFGSDHIMSYRAILTNAASSQSSGRAWTSTTVDLLSETMLTGTRVGGQAGYEVGIEKSQLPLFLYYPELIKSDDWYWLRNVLSSTAFCAVNENGVCDNLNPSTGQVRGSSSVGGIRPVFAVK